MIHAASIPLKKLSEQTWLSRPFSWRRVFCIASCVLLGCSSAFAESPFGAAALPGGQPLGGGKGYTAGVSRNSAAHCVNSLESLKLALEKAQAGEIVWIETGSIIDFTGVRLQVPKQVTLAGDRGLEKSEGPLLHARHSGDQYFIQMRAGSRLSGVRVRGSNPPLKDHDMQKSDPPGYAISCVDAEVDNCEISHFQRGGVAMFRECTHSHIHHNFLHDIAAYPVLLGNGTGDGHLIEANRIEWAWHAIASNGSRGSGYVARHNEFVRVIRPKLFDPDHTDSPNWCLDTHANEREPSGPDRPPTRKLVVEHNTFLAHPAVRVGDGSDLIESRGAYPKHDIYVGPGKDMTTTVEIQGNRFLMFEKSTSANPFKPYGQAIRLVGLKGHPLLPDDPGAPKDVWKVTLGENLFGVAR